MIEILITVVVFNNYH